MYTPIFIKYHHGENQKEPLQILFSKETKVPT